LIQKFCLNESAAVIFDNATSTGAFVTLVIALCFPSVIYFALPLGMPSTISFTLLTVAEIISSIVFLCKKFTDTMPLIITQASILGAFLIAMLIIIASTKKEETK